MKISARGAKSQARRRETALELVERHIKTWSPRQQDQTVVIDAKGKETTKGKQAQAVVARFTEERSTLLKRLGRS